MLIIGTLILLSAIATVALIVASPLFKTISLAIESFAAEAR